jgi:hypothetical protein
MDSASIIGEKDRGDAVGVGRGDEAHGGELGHAGRGDAYSLALLEVFHGRRHA